jgi:hypothetical protein
MVNLVAQPVQDLDSITPTTTTAKLQIIKPLQSAREKPGHFIQYPYKTDNA